MGKYIIAIGGTGIKCLESFLHISAINGFNSKSEKYNVLIVEGDVANGNKKRLQDTAINYKACQNVFFPKGIAIDNVNKNGVTREQRLIDREIQNNIKRGLFKDRFSEELGVTGFEVWSPDSKKESLDDMCKDANEKTSDVIKVLYNENERETNLNVGFKGHPNIGSLTMDYLMNLDDEGSSWYNFLGKGNREIAEQGMAGNVNEIVEVFVVGSVFGGTGAAGLYSIVNKISKYSYVVGEAPHTREINYARKIQHGLIKVNVCMMLPYFSLPPKPEDLDSKLYASDLMENTVHALSYYLDQSEFINNISLILIGKSNMEIMKEEKGDGKNGYAVGDSKQRNKSMTPEVLAALAIGQAFGNIKFRQGTVSYIGRENQPDENNRVISWESIPTPREVAFKEKLRDMLVFALCYRRKIYPVIESKFTDVSKYFWLGKCYGDMDNELYGESLYINAKQIDDYCKAYIEWVLDISTAGESNIETYNLIDYKKIEDLRITSIDADVDYAHLIEGIERFVNWNKMWEYINENGKEYPADGKGLHRLITRIYDGIRR